MNYKNPSPEKVYGGGIEHTLGYDQRFISLYGNGLDMTTAGVTLRTWGNTAYKVPTGYTFFPVALTILITDASGVRIVTMEYSDDVDASTNPFTLAVFSTPDGLKGAQGAVLTYPIHAIQAPTGKYINIKANLGAGSPYVISCVGYQSEQQTTHNPPINTPI